MSVPSNTPPANESTRPPTKKPIATAHHESTTSAYFLNAMVPSDHTSAPVTAYMTPRPDTWPSRAPALTTTMPAKPTSSPSTFPQPSDSPSSGAASTPVSTG